MVAGLNVGAITNVLKQLDLEGLGSGIGSALAGGGNKDNGSMPPPSPPPSNGVDTGATRVLPGKELILPVAADSDEAANVFSKSLSGLDRDTFNRLEKIKRQTEIETGSPREKAYRAAQLRSDIARDRFASMPTRTAMQDVNQFRDPYYSDSSDWDLADSRNAARNTWADAANIASARKAAVYGDDPFEQGYVPKDAYETEAWTPPAWSEFPKGLSGLPQVGSPEWNNTPDNPDIPPIIGDPGPVDPVNPVNPVIPDYKVSKGTAGDYNWDLRQNEGWSGTHWDSPRDDADIYGTGSFARTNWLTDQFKNFAGDDNNLSYDEYVQGITTRPDDNAYNPYTMANALANYWATSGATVDPRALSDRDLFLQGDKLVQRLGTGDVGPNLALSDYVSFDKKVPDGDEDYYRYYNWMRKV